MADQPTDPARPAPAPPSWMPHLWVVVVPIGAVILAYALWFTMMAILTLPDWLARILH